MLHPLKRMGVSAVLWYQGEANTHNPERYVCSFPQLIKDWRHQFESPSLPFYFVLLAPFTGGGSAWPLNRLAQLGALSLPHTGAASAMDAGYPQNIHELHPKNKSIIGTRLAGLVRNGLYGARVPTAGPKLVSARATLVGATLFVIISMDTGDAPVHTSLLTIDPPGCTTCCSTRSLAQLFTLRRAPSTGLIYQFNTSLSGTTFVLQLDVSADSFAWGNTSNVWVQLQHTAWPQCILYNDLLLPADPFVRSVSITTSVDMSELKNFRELITPVPSSSLSSSHLIDIILSLNVKPFWAVVLILIICAVLCIHHCYQELVLLLWRGDETWKALRRRQSTIVDTEQHLTPGDDLSDPDSWEK